MIEGAKDMEAQAGKTGWRASRWAPPLLTGLFTYVALMILNAWHVGVNSAWRTVLVGGASGALANYLVGRLRKHAGPD
ncbi:hypothetical protein QE363_000591 [Sphingomonas sp. SORGH_AS870]|uniref:hypothetical protein n=1 Tax=Sphingomonas sp. SORGH_AS_0870 TaxID=3041801 RepID=UPI002856CA25|nr:hypothetical protein [Sphingomonas sp. SORGH_AS_0870]MDR6144798.1 hypothetical protein [Sphingomonas sp. SORGH_AS_0870]